MLRSDPYRLDWFRGGLLGSRLGIAALIVVVGFWAFAGPSQARDPKDFSAKTPGGRPSADSGVAGGVRDLARENRGGIKPDEFGALVRTAIEVRGLSVGTRVSPHFIDRAELAEVLSDEFGSAFSPGEIEDYEYALIAIGLWPGGRSLVDEHTRVMGEEVLGLYLPSKRRVYVVDGAAPSLGADLSEEGKRMMRDVPLAHEIIHVLQHEHYPEFFDPAALSFDHDDLQLAERTAIEGDAMYYGLRAIIGRPSLLPPARAFAAQTDQLVAASTSSAFKVAPAYLRRSLMFPYIEGYRLAFNEGARLLDKPPVSTEQARHSEKRGEPFWGLSLAELGKPAGDACARVHENTMGELGVEVLLTGADPDSDPEAWEGWNGDRYLVARCAHGPEIVWISLWDSEDDAREFARAYRDVAGRLVETSSLRRPARVRRDGDAVVIATPGYGEIAEKLAWTVPRMRVNSRDQLISWMEHRQAKAKKR